jgi:hypothetical protein
MKYGWPDAFRINEWRADYDTLEQQWLAEDEADLEDHKRIRSELGHERRHYCEEQDTDG